jgi:hypothetical protein
MSFAVLIKVLAQSDTNKIHTKAIIPVPNLPSIPHILLLRSLEKSVENIRERNTNIIPPSKTPFMTVSFPFHMSLIISITIIIVPKNSTNKPMPLSVQSQGKGIIDNGARKRIVLKICF